MYAYMRLHSEVKFQCLFTSVRLRLVYNLRKKIGNWNSEKGFGRLWLFACGLGSFAGDLYQFVIVCWWFVVVCGGLWSLPELVNTIFDVITSIL